MDTVTIDGVEYVKASVLARKHRYTSDYIGQLCRGKKVDAHLVGRTWYVYPPSLEGHQSTRYAELRSGDKMADKSKKISSSRIDVEAPLSKSLLKNHKPHFQDRMVWKPSEYEIDEAALLPVAFSKPDQQPVRMPVKLAEGKRVRVASVSKNISMVSKPLPAIALAGTIRVQDYTPNLVPEGSVEQDNFVDNSSYSDYEDPLVDELQKTDRLPTTPMAPGSAAAFMRRLDNTSVKSHTRGEAGILPSTATSDEGSVPVSTKTKRLHHQRRSLAIPKRPLTPSQDLRTSLFFKLVIAPAVILFLAGVSATLLAVETVMVVEGGEQLASLRFDPSLFGRIFTAWR
jgi:hypothetical protein